MQATENRFAMTRDGERNREVRLQGSSLDYDRETPLPSGIERKESKVARLRTSMRAVAIRPTIEIAARPNGFTSCDATARSECIITNKTLLKFPMST